MSEGLVLETKDHVLTATVDRGDDNSFSGEMIDELSDAIEAAGRDEEVRFVRIRARGPAFCLGRDRQGQTPDELRAEAGRIVRINETCKTSPLTIICEVQGDAAGFGAGLVASSDVAIAADHASIYFPEMKAGLAPTIVLSWVAYALPHKTAFDMAATGRKMPVSEAASWGLVSEAVPASQLESRVNEKISELTAMHPLGLREVKRFMGHIRSLDPVAAARNSIDPLVLGALRLGSKAAACGGD